MHSNETLSLPSATIPLQQEQLGALLASVCNQARESTRQTDRSIVQSARRHLHSKTADVHALHVVAAESLAHHQPSRALSLLTQEGDALAGNPTGNRLAGYAWLSQADLHQASQFFHQAVQLDPNQPDCWRWLGRIAELADDDEKATGFYQRGILFDDGRHGSAIALSKLHSRKRRLKDAIHTLRVCLIDDQRSPQLNLALARLLNRRAANLGRRNRFELQQRVRAEALECYRVVNAVSPSPSSFVMQGRLEQQLYEFENAKNSFQKAVDKKPTAVTLCYLAAANVEVGEIELALEQFEASLDANPDRAETHFRYSRAKRFSNNRKTRRYLRTLNKQIGRTNLSKRQQVYLNFALAKVYDDIRNFDRAWTHYQRANLLKTTPDDGKGKLQGNRTAGQSNLKLLVERSIHYFSKERFDRCRESGHPSNKPVFIVGMPRSGTTLTEQILSSHPEVAGAGELNLINRIRQILSSPRSPRPHSQASLSGQFPFLLTHVAPAELRRHADHYLRQLNQFGADASRVTDKMPTNFMHLGLIATLFPGATVIHCRRHPLDVMVSCFCQNLNAPFCDLNQLVDYHRDYRRLMAHWERVLPISIYNSDYESLVSDPERSTRALLRHCDLEWSEQCLEFQSNARAVHTPSKWQVRQPMYQSSVEKWRRFEKQLTPIANQIFAEIESEARDGQDDLQLALTR